MVWLGWRQKTSGAQLLAHTYCKPERKLHPLNDNSEWNVFSLSTLPLWWMVKRAGVGFLWYESPHVSFGRVLASFGRNHQSQSLSSRDCPGLWLKVLSRSGKVYNQLYWLEVIGTVDKDIRSLSSHWVRAVHKIPTLTLALESIH